MVSVLEGFFFNPDQKSIHNRRISIKSVRNRGVLITELKKVTYRGFFVVIEGCVIEGFYCI